VNFSSVTPAQAAIQVFAGKPKTKMDTFQAGITELGTEMLQKSSGFESPINSRLETRNSQLL
jgi:hypothetical protein